MGVAAIVVAAGEGARFGGRKQFSQLAGRPVAAVAVEAARSVAGHVVLVVPPDALSEPYGADVVVAGGATRSASVRAGLAVLPDDVDTVVVHDAARPLATPALFAAVLDALASTGAAAAIPAVAVPDTLKRLDGRGGVAATVSRDGLVAVQTPQAFRAVALRRAHELGGEASDDAALVEATGGRVVVVAGEPQNRKLTTREDLAFAEGLVGSSARVGHGHDVHRASADPTRRLVLAGVEVPGARGLEGHSDADVATHALCDAVLGAAGLGDLGRHFPDDDPAHAGVSSLVLLAGVLALAAEAGYEPVNADVTIVAQAPRLAPHLDAMAACLTAALGAPASVKATTPEGLGAIGRGEGIAAAAVALLRARR